jgi:hypothetical protein
MRLRLSGGMWAAVTLVYPFPSLDNNGLGRDGGRAIAEALQTNSTLTKLQYVCLCY